MDKITTTNINFKSRKVVVYVETKNPVDQLIAKWFSDNNIYRLEFKSKAWSYISKKRNALFAERINKLLKLAPDQRVTFSYTAGCSCGCSPGFLIKQNGRNIPRISINGQLFDSIWVDIDSADLVSNIQEYIIKANKKLSTELIANGLSNDEDMINSMQLMA